MSALSLSKISLVAITAFSLSACNEETKSDNVDTKGIWAGINVTSNGTKTDVSVELNVSGANGNNVSLSNSDKLIAKAGSESKTLTRNNSILDIDYEGSLNTTASGSEFTISFTRGNKQDAPNSKVKLPDAFNIILPLSEQSIRFSDPISIAWTPKKDGSIIEVVLESVCKNSSDADVNLKKSVKIVDSGTHIYNHGSDDFNAIDKSKGCTSTVTLTREVSATLDTNFQAGGFIKAFQKRSVTKVKLVN